MIKIKYPSLNGLRAISVILVIINHLSLIDHIFNKYTPIKWLNPLTSFLQDGQLGVTVFFVISGFLITSLMQQEEINSKSLSLKKFYIRRALRIFPAYYFLLFVYFILHHLKILEISNASWFTALTYTKYFNWQLDWATSHLWSLSIEENFYLLWPLIFILGEKARKSAAIGILIFVPLMRIYIHSYPNSWIDDLSIFTRMDSIATGCLCAMYKDTIIKKISPYWTILFYVSCIYIFFLPHLAFVAGHTDLGFIFIPFGFSHGTIANFLIAIIVLYSVFGPQRLWFKFLNLRAMNYIGMISYSLYLWQEIFISWSGYWATSYPQNFFLFIIAALISYYLIEKPFLKLKTKFSTLKE